VCGGVLKLREQEKKKGRTDDLPSPDVSNPCSQFTITNTQAASLLRQAMGKKGKKRARSEDQDDSGRDSQSSSTIFQSSTSSVSSFSSDEQERKHKHKKRRVVVK